MYIYQELAARAAQQKPVRVGLIGAGKFGSMFLSQVPTTQGLEVAQIADLNPNRAKQACRDVGWDVDGVIEDLTGFVIDQCQASSFS
jgi:predicted homoserine dehydrogenase-like protein